MTLRRSRPSSPRPSTEALSLDARNEEPADQAMVTRYTCDACFRDISRIVRIQCAECDDIDLCVECFGMGAPLSSKPHHQRTHSYRVLKPADFCLFNTPSQAVTGKTPKGRHPWRADEDFALLEAIEANGMGNWEEIAQAIGKRRTPEECLRRYSELFLNWPGQPGLVLCTILTFLESR